MAKANQAFAHYRFYFAILNPMHPLKTGALEAPQASKRGFCGFCMSRQEGENLSVCLRIQTKTEAENA